MRTILFAACLLMTLAGAHAQTCNTKVPKTSPSGNYVDNKDGTVTDVVNRLMWMQCSVGQTWDNGDCEGDADELTWQQALVYAHGFSFASKTGWRVPNIKELETLVERRCERPSIEATLFPSTRSDDYWTSTPAAQDPARAWVIAFFNGSNAVKDKQLFVFTRLVRTVD